MATPVTVLSGYLGAGKTTVLNGILGSADGRRIGVVVNDFGAVNVDASLVRSRTEDTIELTDGCICCSLRGEVGEVMRRLAAREDLDAIVMEASGVADPAGLASWGTFPGLSPAPIVVCVDATAILRLLADEYVADVIEAQIRRAGVLVLTHCDGAGADRLDQVLVRLAALTDATVVRSAGGDLTAADLLPGAAAVPVPSEPAAASNGPNASADSGSGGGADADLDAASAHPDAAGHRNRSVDLAAPVDLGLLEQAVAALPVEVVRVKGVVRDLARGGSLVVLQRAGGPVEVRGYSGGGDPWLGLVLIAVGPGAEEVLEESAAQVRSILDGGT